MKYEVLVSFTDDKDVAAPKSKNIYWAGKSTYPRDGYTPQAERLAYLQGDKNRFKKPIITKREELAAEEPKEKK